MCLFTGGVGHWFRTDTLFDRHLHKEATLQTVATCTCVRFVDANECFAEISRLLEFASVRSIFRMRSY